MPPQLVGCFLGFQSWRRHNRREGAELSGHSGNCCCGLWHLIQALDLRQFLGGIGEQQQRIRPIAASVLHEAAAACFKPRQLGTGNRIQRHQSTPGRSTFRNVALSASRNQPGIAWGACFFLMDRHSAEQSATTAALPTRDFQARLRATPHTYSGSFNDGVSNGSQSVPCLRRLRGFRVLRAGFGVVFAALSCGSAVCASAFDCRTRGGSSPDASANATSRRNSSERPVSLPVTTYSAGTA